MPLNGNANANDQSDSQRNPSATPLPAQPSFFLESVIRFLLPYFLPTCPDKAAARTEILHTLRSYGARTRSAMLDAAQIIAFGFSALDTLAEATAAEMSPSMRLRFRGCANNLNRNGQKTEQTLVARLACDRPAAANPAAEPVNDVPDDEADAAIQHAKARIQTYRNGLSGSRSSVLPSRDLSPEQQQESNRLWGGAMMNVLAGMGMPVQPAPTG